MLWKAHGTPEQPQDQTYPCEQALVTETAQTRRGESQRRLCVSTRLLLSGFTYSWTLSSKFFSTFPHGTCSLSDSCQYLALDGVYHPLRAAFSSNPTPETARPVGVALAKALHLPWVTSFKRTSVLASPASSRPLPHSSRQRSAERFRAGLIPLHSPLVGESWLVSFPPLS